MGRRMVRRLEMGSGLYEATGGCWRERAVRWRGRCVRRGEAEAMGNAFEWIDEWIVLRKE